MSDEFVLRIDLPDWSKERLVSVMRKRLPNVRSATSCKSRNDRHVVNMLRHNFTNYDVRQSADDFILVVSTIAEKYPWLAVECTRQIAYRLKKEAFSSTNLAA